MSRRAPAAPAGEGRGERRPWRLAAALATLLIVAAAPGCAGQSGPQEARGEGVEEVEGVEGRVQVDETAGEGAGGDTGGPAMGVPAAGQSPPAAPPVTYAVEVVESFPHDRDAFTQGLLLEAPGVLLESTGLYGRSELRRVDLASGEVMRRQALPEDLFGEGLARVAAGEGGGEGDHLVQLTWRSGRALVWDAADFRQRPGHTYSGEGWGLCHQATAEAGGANGGRLVMSDGSHRLSFRDPATFAPLGEVEVTLEGRPLRSLNELECVGDRVWANALGSRQLFEIDPASGRVVGVADTGRLLTVEESAGADVLNGIAHDPADGTFLVTGKLWPTVFRLRLTATGAGVQQSPPN